MARNAGISVDTRNVPVVVFLPEMVGRESRLEGVEGI